MLAPLLDRMVTQHVSQRFTASEALDFLEKFYYALPLDKLNVPVAEPHSRYLPHHVDRWKGLPEEFVRTWSHHRVSGPSLSVRLLRFICSCHIGAIIVRSMRRLKKILLSVLQQD
jgi:hypothetical protein